VSHNALSGALPANWGWNNVLTMLEVLTLDDNSFSGPLPPGFGSAGAFKSLLVLNLDNNRFTGEDDKLLLEDSCRRTPRAWLMQVHVFTRRGKLLM
jgi:hypothetical protein